MLAKFHKTFSTCKIQSELFKRSKKGKFVTQFVEVDAIVEHSSIKSLFKKSILAFVFANKTSSTFGFI